MTIETTVPKQLKAIVGVDRFTNKNIMAGPGKEADRPKMKKAAEEIPAATTAMGGRISGEHGNGLAKQPFIGLNLDRPSLDLSRRLKRFFAPINILNPGKIFTQEVDGAVFSA